MIRFNSEIYFFEFLSHLGLGITFPARTTVVKLQNQQALVIAPGPFDSETIRDLKAHKKLFFVAPNAFHHLHLSKVMKDFPESSIYAAEGVKRKQKKLSSQLHPISELQPLIKKEIEMITIEGNSTLDESVFWHPASQTLILTDLFFYMTEPMPLLRRWILKLVKAHNRPSQSQLIKKTTQDRKRFQDSIRRLIELNPENLIIAHGPPIQGKEQAKTILSHL